MYVGTLLIKRNSSPGEAGVYTEAGHRVYPAYMYLQRSGGMLLSRPGGGPVGRLSSKLQPG